MSATRRHLHPTCSKADNPGPEHPGDTDKADVPSPRQLQFDRATVRGRLTAVRKDRKFARRSPLPAEELLKDPPLNLPRLFFTPCGMRGRVQPHLKNVGNRNSVARYLRPKYCFPIGRFFDIDVRRSTGMIDRETETAEGIERETLQVDVCRRAMNESVSQCIRGSEQSETASRYSLDDTPVWMGRSIIAKS